MGIMDKIKGMFGSASKQASSVTDKAGDLADKADVGGMVDKVGDVAGSARESVGGVVEGAVDKVADVADSATKGKFSDQIDKVRDAADHIDGQDDIPDAPETPEA